MHCTWFHRRLHIYSLVNKSEIYVRRVQSIRYSYFLILSIIFLRQCSITSVPTHGTFLIRLNQSAWVMQLAFTKRFRRDQKIIYFKTPIEGIHSKTRNVLLAGLMETQFENSFCVMSHQKEHKGFIIYDIGFIIYDKALIQTEWSD